MGSGRWDPSAYATTTRSYAGKSTAQVFTARSTHATLEPKGVKVRESRDSADNPLSTPIIAALDVTGSMGSIADKIAREGLGTLFKEILDRKPVSDPHLMFMALGDVKSDRAPLQVSQFEADVRIVEQLTNIYLEGNGGGNGTESYNLPWYFAAMRTSIDSYEKRGKRGYLFTVGDEEAPNVLTSDDLKRTFDEPLEGLSNQALLDMVKKMYHVFHVVVEEGNHFRYYPDKVRSSWKAMLGENVLYLSDYTKLSEVIVSTIQIIEGADAGIVAKSWSGDTALVVANATRGLVPGAKGTASASAGPVKL